MRRSTILMVLAASALLGQETNKVAVPLSDPSRPAQIKVNLMSGSITVRGGAGKEVIVETKARQSERRRPEPVPKSAEGLRRLDLGNSIDLEIEESSNAVTIRNRHSAKPQDLIIQVPSNSSVNLKTMNSGEIVVEGVNGELAVNNMNGGVNMRHVSGTVLANSMNGEVTVVMDRVDANKPSSFSTMNGNIDVTLPSDLKARVKMKAANGDVFSDFDIKSDNTDNKPVVESGEGKYRVKFNQGTFGTINGGGPEFQFSTFNGQIMIRKKP